MLSRGRSPSSPAESVSLPPGPVRDLVLHSSDYYSNIAAQLRANTPWSRRKFSGTHWLCRRLDDLSKQLDPATFAQLARQPVSDGLRKLGFPAFVAEVLGAASALGAKQALGAIPMTHLGEFLRVLVPLVCPDFPHCPAYHDASETFRLPTVCDHLRELTDGTD